MCYKNPDSWMLGQLMKVSIIIPALDEEECLPVCLQSIASLSYPSENVEVIVADNGSSDKTREISKSYGAKVICNDTVNVSGLRNLGAESAKHDVLAFIDADCIVSMDWLRSAVKYSEDLSVTAWGSPPTVPADATWVQRTWYLVRKKEHPIVEVQWLESMNLFIRKELFNRVGGFDERLVTCEDVDLCYRIGEHGKIISDEKIQVVHTGEARTIREFVRKEIWRGQGNIQGIRSHGFSLKEIPSFLVPIYFGLMIPSLFMATILFLEPYLLIASVLLMLMPSAMAILKMRRKSMRSSDILRLSVLLPFYFFARTVAVVHRRKRRTEDVFAEQSKNPFHNNHTA
jgi:glycosyltransferase involved in cell wall biosynthesis